MPSEPPSATAVRPAARLEELFGIDLRSLAAFRIGLGTLLLWDLYGRAKTLRMHYTGEGVFPLRYPGQDGALHDLAAAWTPDAKIFHLFLLSDRFEVQAALFVLFALFALALLVGWHTRLASVLSFVCLASLVRRNPYVCHTGDVWLKALGFWAMFLPLGAHFSLDRLRSPWRASGRPRALSLATAGVTLQIAIFYVFAGYLKSRYEVWQHGDAVWVFTHVIEYTRPFGAWLGQFPGACRLFTYATLVFEGLAPFVLFFPFGTRVWRTGFCLALAAFHLTLQATIHIGLFQLLCLVALALLVPSSAWDGLARTVPARLRGRWGALRDAFRARFGRAQAAEAPPPGVLRRAGSLAASAALVSAFAVVLVSNANSAVEDPYRHGTGLVALPRVVDDYGRMMSLVQSWNMFTDIERRFYGWFLVLGQQEDGAIVDVLAGTPFQEIRVPEHYARFFPNHNSRRYWRQLTEKDDDGQSRVYLQKPMCDYLAREWAGSGHSPLTHLAIFHIGQVPLQKAERDQVMVVCDDWEARHEPLRSAAPEVQRRWIAWRESWRSFLAGLPKTVPAAR